MPFPVSRGAFLPRRIVTFSFVLLALCFLSSCGRPPEDNAPASSSSQNLPFDRQPRTTGISPSQSLIPSTTKLPEGTPIPIRLQSALSTVSAHAGDTFYGVIDEPVVVDGQTRVPSGTPVTGRVLEAKAAGPSKKPLEPGYLRIVLVSLQIGGKAAAIETSSIFAKGGTREKRNSPAPGSAGAQKKDKVRNRDISFAVNRRLDFRLAQAVDLQ